MTPSLYLIDVSALAYRSFFAFIKAPLRNSKGEETSAIFGFSNHILRLIAERKPTHIAFVKDLKGPTKRHEKYEEYKAHRKPMPDGLVSQLPMIDEFVEKSGLRTVSLKGYEADDVMATLALQARAKGFKTYIVTRDKDMMQLVDDSIFLFDLGKQNEDSLVVGAAEVKEKMGVGPEHIVDLLSLMGDSSDNVPGVSSVGPKSAVDLLQTYGSLENIYKNVGSISKKGLRENLIKDRDNAFLSKELVTLHTDLELPVTLEDLKYTGVNVEGVRTFLERYELKSVIKLIPGASMDSMHSTSTATKAVEPKALLQQVPVTDEAAKPKSAGTYTLVNDVHGLRILIDKLKHAKVLAVDTETTGLDTRTASLVGICLSFEPETGYYLALGHTEGPNLDLNDVVKALKPIFDDAHRTMVFHNAKYDLPILERHGFELLPSPDRSRTAMIIDTMIAAHLCSAGDRAVSLDDLALKHFQHTMIPIEALIGKGKNQKSFADTPQAEAAEYGAEDADFTLRLWNLYEKELREKELENLFLEIEMALLPVLIEMETLGVAVDIKALRGLSRDLTQESFRLEREIHEIAGHPFNVSSPTQLQQVLFEEMGLKTGKKTKSGYSTDVSVLQKLEDEHPIIGKILDYREMSKLRGTYAETLPEQADEHHRIHTSYSQVIAATGRLSSINPNLQNIPIRTELGRKIRGCFVAPQGRVLLCADYSQIELRLLAHLSGDPALKEAYQKGLDIHARTAAALYGVAEDDVTSDMRRSAKVVNFGVLYGMGAHRLAGQLKILYAEAKRFIENYFASYARVDLFIKETVEKAQRSGYVETLAGRKRYLPDLHSDNRMMRENAERIAVNTPIQGSAADLIKIAMIQIHHRLQREKLSCDMLLQVHDELVFEIEPDCLKEASEIIRHEMEHAMQLSVPLIVDMGHGKNWLEAKGGD